MADDTTTIEYYQSKYTGKAIDEAVTKIYNLYSLLYDNEIPENSFLAMLSDGNPGWITLTDVEEVTN